MIRSCFPRRCRRSRRGRKWRILARMGTLRGAACRSEAVMLTGRTGSQTRGVCSRPNNPENESGKLRRSFDADPPLTNRQLLERVKMEQPVPRSADRMRPKKVRRFDGARDWRDGYGHRPAVPGRGEGSFIAFTGGLPSQARPISWPAAIAVRARLSRVDPARWGVASTRG